MNQLGESDLLHSCTARALTAAFVVMVFSPWIYLIRPSAHPQIILLPFVLGLGTAIAFMPKNWRGASTAVIVVTLLVIPTNIIGHLLAHVTINGCYY